MIPEIAHRTFTSVLAGFFFFGLYSFYPMLFPYFLLVLYLYIMLHELPLFFANKSLLRKIPWSIICRAYPTISIACLWYLHRHYYKVHPFIPLYPYLASWIFDTGSYLLGSRIGRHHVTLLSPKKTWEGILGGYLGLVLFHFFLFKKKLGIEIGALSALVGAAAFAGDLFESYLKRKAGIKHSGNILPGHGGVLDRFDSVFFVGILTLVLLTLTNYFLALMMRI